MQANAERKQDLSRPGTLISGAGVGLRSQHYREILAELPKVEWFEVLTDNYFAAGGADLAKLESIRAHYPFTMHSVGMSIGGTDPIDFGYLKKIKVLKDRFEPAWISEHLCWTSHHGIHFHDLFPLPYTEETVRHVSKRIRDIQDFFGEQILIENVSSYVSYQDSEMTEWEFVSAVVEEADCSLLLDLSNVYISSLNNNFSAPQYVDFLPAGHVKEIHLAGFEDRQSHLLDTHNCAVAEPVWDFYREVIARLGPVPTLIEWDSDLPALHVLLNEARRADEVIKHAQAFSC